MITKVKTKDHEEWINLRKGFLGGSDASAVVNMNPYKSRYSLWAEKLDKIPAFEGNITTKVGNYLEDFVAKLFEEETGKKVRRDNHSIFNDKYPFAIADVDRVVVGENAILEIKTTNSLPIAKEINKGEVYGSWWCQVMHYMALTEAKKAYLAVLVNCREFRFFEIERDQAEIDALMEAEKEFWELVKTNTPPSVDGSDSTSDTLNTLYPESNGQSIDLSMFATELDEYASLNAQIKALTELKDEKVNSIKEYMKEAEKGTYKGFSVSFKTQSRKSLDTDKLAKEHSEIKLDDYYKFSTSRVFKITEKKEK